MKAEIVGVEVAHCVRWRYTPLPADTRCTPDTPDDFRNGNAYKRQLRRDFHRVSPALPAPFMIHCTCTCRLQAPKLQVLHTPFSPGIFTCRVLHTSIGSRESCGLKHVIVLAARKRWPSYEDIGRAFTPTMAAPITKSRRLPLRHWRLLANWQEH